MRIDLQGRVEKLKLGKNKGLLPLFEAVVNSIHAIQDAERDGGKIEVTLLRDKTEASLLGDSNDSQILPLKAFHIADNGIGFTERNFDSFLTSDSRYKIERGGKGVGRFFWLKAFEYVDISSVYNENGEKRKREFRFSLHDDPEVATESTHLEQEAKVETVVKLCGFLPEYSKNAPRNAEVIAKHLVEHCLRFFMLDTMPQLIVSDQETGDFFNAQTLYGSYVSDHHDEDILIGEENFRVTHMMFSTSSGINHKISYCADHRVVKDKPIRQKDVNGITPRLKNPNEDGSDSSTYVAYVSGSYLDKHVDDNRSNFTFPITTNEEIDLLISFDRIHESVIECSREFLKAYTDPILEEHKGHIREFIQSKRPEYRLLVKFHDDALKNIPTNLTDEQLDIELYKLYKYVGLQLRQKTEKVIQNKEPLGVDNFRDFFDEFDEFGKSRLADYIAFRHSTLRLLQASLNKKPEGGYSLEDVILMSCSH